MLPGPSVPPGCSITEAVTILGNKLRDYQGQFNTTHLLALCDYFHNTFIRHYKLYQYVLGQDRDVNLTVANLEVCTPPQPLPLAEGKDREVWKHEQQLEGLSTAEVQKRTNMLLLKGALRLEQQHLLRETFSRLPGQQHQTLNREVRGARGAGGGSPAPVYVPFRQEKLRAGPWGPPPWEGAGGHRLCAHVS